MKKLLAITFVIAALLNTAVQPTNAQSTTSAQCTADYNNSGSVDIADFQTFAANYKQQGITCSLDLHGADCFLDIADFGEFARVYKQPRTVTCGGATSSTLTATTAATTTTSPASPYLYGTVDSHAQNINSIKQAGVKLVTVSAYWDRFELQEGTVSATYTSQLKSQLNTFRSNGMQIILDLGVHFPPAWIFNYANSVYVNQYGDEYRPGVAGKSIANMVFNNTMRQKQAAYIGKLLQEIGTDFYAIRLGGGWYGELNYPDNNYNSHSNSYWAYDQVAKGLAGQLPSGISALPSSDWTPGSADATGTKASTFANWYLDALLNYQNWQIQTLRQHYSGRLAVLYPSWGIRPGQLQAAVQTGLNGQTSVEQNGEIQRGFDFARLVGGITDANVVVYTTWLDANLGNDNSANPADWNPVHYLASLAQANPRNLRVWGENTGGNSLSEMQHSFSQMRKYSLLGLNWAFEPELFDGQHASLAQFQQLIQAN